MTSDTFDGVSGGRGPDMLLGDLGFLVARLGAAAQRTLTDALSGSGLRARQYALLQMVADTGRSQRELGPLLGLEASNVVTLVDQLVAAGYVERRSDERDRRVRLVALTPAGVGVLDGAARISREAEDRLFGALDADERRDLGEMLRKVVKTVV
ncbi:MarR family winged helix-turn-helix transcriptional regulator [Millisia brevis]|uniref:MarR family winged helix-turn-helix transcriptional regulator n=1 Tax=Millisia brevis TaxID=264148 RepID=UPI00083105B1|nr:MarR family transcriptional regulator [Millisia brevis]